jgi:Xaa-Pro dipeptidase
MINTNSRLNKVRADLLANNVDCLALVPGFNFRYITGIDFLQSERPLILFIPQSDSQTPVLPIPELEVTSCWMPKNA